MNRPTLNISELVSYFDNSTESEDIPSNIIDICARICSGLRSYQYIIISGHGISTDVIQNAYESSSQFFHLPYTEKITYYSKDRARRGYSGNNDDNFASLIGQSNRPNDYVEKYRIGPILTDDERLNESSSSYYETKEGRIHFYPNNYPESIPQFELSMSAYYQSVANLTIVLLRAIEIALNLPNIITSSMNRHTSILSANYYQSIALDVCLNRDEYAIRCVDERKIERVAAHKDVSILTIVSQWTSLQSSYVDGFESESHTLEIWTETKIDDDSNEHGYWQSIKLIDDELIVHVGDCLEDWSNHLFRSTLHRVVTTLPTDVSSTDRNLDSATNEYANERYSLAYFVSPDYDAIMDSFDYSLSRESVGTYSKWRKSHIKKALSVQHKNTATER